MVANFDKATVEKYTNPKNHIWQLKDETIARMESEGVITAIGVGETEVKLVVDNSSELSYVASKIIIRDDIVLPTSITLHITGDDQKKKITAEVFPSNAQLSEINWYCDDEMVTMIPDGNRLVSY